MWTPSSPAWLGNVSCSTRGSRRRNGETAPMGTCPGQLWRSVPSTGGAPSMQWYNNLCVTPPRMSGTLFVVATPIGNLEDITLRALRVLRESNVVAAEDTRRTAKLLSRHRMQTLYDRLFTITTHMAVCQGLVARLEAGNR